MYNVMKGEKLFFFLVFVEFIIYNLLFYMYVIGKYNMNFLIIILFVL